MADAPLDGVDARPDGKPPTSRKLQAAKTRDRVLNAAADVFGEVGYEAATVAVITQRAGTSHGTFYHYFQNKDDAFAEVIAQVLAETVAAAEPDPERSPFDSLMGQIEGFLMMFVRRRGLMRALMEGMMRNERVEQIWRDLHTYNATGISHRLEEALDLGLIREMDIDLAGKAMASMAEWFAFSELILAPETAATKRRVKTLVATLGDLCYHAVYGEVPAGGGAPPVPVAVAMAAKRAPARRA